MTFLSGDVGRCISIDVLSVQIISGVDEHLEYVEAISKSSRQMQGVVALLIGVVDVDTFLGEHSHSITVTTSGCDPKGIQTFFILLIDINSFVF